MLDKTKFIWGSVLWSINQSTESLTRLLSCFSRIVGPALKPIFSPLKKCWTRIVCVAESSRNTYPGLFLLLQLMRKTTSWDTVLSSNIFTLTLNQKNYYFRITWSFCLRQYVQNGLSYLCEETQLTLCKNNAKLRTSIVDLRQNKHQLLHRFTSVKTPLIYNILMRADLGSMSSKK